MDMGLGLTWDWALHGTGLDMGLDLTWDLARGLREQLWVQGTCSCLEGFVSVHPDLNMWILMHCSFMNPPSSLLSLINVSLIYF